MVGAAATIAVAMPRIHASVGQPMIVTNPTGSVVIHQELPCSDNLDIERQVIGGRIDVTPTQRTSRTDAVIRTFNLTRMDLFLDPFTVQRKCRGVEATVQFQEIGIRLVRSLLLTVPSDRGENLGDGKFRFTVPPDEFPLFESVRDNAPVKQPEQRLVKPSSNVIILIDTRAGNVDISFELTSLLKFKSGPIDETKPGTLTGRMTGDVVPPNADQDNDGVPDTRDNCPADPNPTQAPDTAAPLVSCTATRPPGGGFLVSATDLCTGKVSSIRLGGFPIANGEVIKIDEVGKKGDPVRLLPKDVKGVRHFQVAKGAAIIVATDAAGNVGNAACSK
jgi:hypothetical protein